MASAPDELESLCSHLLERTLDDRRAQDDTALLALRLLPLGDRLTLTLDAEPAILTPLRATLRRWLAEAGADGQEIYELLVAVGEASSNAIRHASGPARATFDVEAAATDANTVEITVRDRGRWRDRASSEGGRGLGIIESFVDDTEIVRSAEGTEVRMRRRLERAPAGVS